MYYICIYVYMYIYIYIYIYMYVYMGAYLGKGNQKLCTTMFLKFQGFFYSLFQHSAISSSFTTLCTIQAIMSNLCQNLSESRKKPLTCINQEICGQKPNLYVIWWKVLTFMKFCGDYYDTHKNKNKSLAMHQGKC